MLKKEYDFSEFDSVSKEQWLEKVSLDLKGKPLDTLDWSLEGNQLTPFYTKEDIEGLPLSSVDKPSNWLNFQGLQASDLDFADHVSQALNNGVDGLIVDFGKELNISKLKGIMPQHCHVSFQSEEGSYDLFRQYVEYLDGLKIDDNSINGLGFWNDLITIDVSAKKIDIEWSNILKIIRLNKFSNFRNILIDTKHFNSKKLSPSTEIAYSLSLMVYIINYLIKEGIELKTALDNVFFKVSPASKYFVEIAKIRALKILVKEVFKQYDNSGDASIPYIHSEISNNKEEGYISCTSEAMSTIIGGVDSISINPNTGTSQNIRVSRNISNIIKEEAYLDKTSDASSGSYFIEKLTYEISKSSWQQFNDIESRGGFVESVKSGFFNQ